MKIVLFGYMGSGKTSVGKALADTLEFSYSDLDELIEKSEGHTIPDVFETRGEIYFRRVENKELHKVLNQSQNIVLSTGGGTPCYGDNLPFMTSRSDVVTVFLRTSIVELTKRLSSEKATRPLIAHLDSEEELSEFIGKHLFERNKFYNQADIILDTDQKPVKEIVKEIVLNLF